MTVIPLLNCIRNRVGILIYHSSWSICAPRLGQTVLASDFALSQSLAFCGVKGSK